MTLDQFKPGSEGLIKRLSVWDKLGQCLMDMGIYPGRFWHRRRTYSEY